MEINESKLIEHELVIRRLRLPKEVLETRRAIVRWLALSLGIINPGESRQSAIPVLDAMLYFQFNKKADPNVREISEYISNTWEPINEKTLRYHLLQLKKANLVDNSKGQYFLVYNGGGDKYDEAVWISGYINSEVDPFKGKVVEAVRALKERQ
jgi:DNA-binding transcriptional ArsR family regulator